MPTVAQLIGGYIACNNAGGGGTLVVGTGGVTGTVLSSFLYYQTYVGMSFNVRVVSTGTTTTTSASGTRDTASNGITPRAAFSSVSSLAASNLVFVNTGTNTWDMIVSE